MNYAAALGDANPWYFDDARPEGIVAPPMLAVALTWPLSADFEASWSAAPIAPAIRARQVHYNESLHWHRPIPAHEDLTIQGEIQAIQPHDAGALIAIRYDAVARDGANVFTEYITGLLRGVSVDGAGAGALPPRQETPDFDGSLWREPVRVDPLAAYLYDGCTDISFPIHTSRRVARAAGLPEPIYHGTATLGLAVKEIINREAAADPRALMEVHCGFRGMVFPGSIILIRVLGTLLENNMKTVYFEVETPEGAMAVRNGRAVLRLTP